MNDWRKLVKQKRFADAEKLMLDDTANVVHGCEVVSRAGFYENWGDAAESKDERKNYYEKARADYYLYASGATGSGEGLQLLMNVERVEKKIARLDKKSLCSRIGLASIVAKVLRRT
ncbi:MAG: hypothetical protein AVDCRST_MAG74-3669 [uncultured Pyrinomonadaceae bacterium]|uniref:Uncharacterized protein n=1 Tax=uncultured Pyrinomonadaceae bacterium TaxID=2283094 RepID=A0A6J4Q2W5_9BACT|nr:MAG: hypothetical protein AVDCRST_MAG74-3669 [uncultured Pyrinomonadaceae bacterium]